MKKTLEIKQDNSGQWMYRLVEGEHVWVDWQYGPFDKPACIQQARSRFAFVTWKEV
jgi:hypothetical protein